MKRRRSNYRGIAAPTESTRPMLVRACDAFVANLTTLLRASLVIGAAVFVQQVVVHLERPASPLVDVDSSPGEQPRDFGARISRNAGGKRPRQALPELHVRGVPGVQLRRMRRRTFATVRRSRIRMTWAISSACNLASLGNPYAASNRATARRSLSPASQACQSPDGVAVGNHRRTGNDAEQERRVHPAWP